MQIEKDLPEKSWISRIKNWKIEHAPTHSQLDRRHHAFQCKTVSQIFFNTSFAQPSCSQGPLDDYVAYGVALHLIGLFLHRDFNLNKQLAKTRYERLYNEHNSIVMTPARVMRFPVYGFKILIIFTLVWVRKRSHSHNM